MKKNKIIFLKTTPSKVKKMKPISPKEVIDDKINNIHPDIIGIVNNFLSQRYNGGYSVVITQDEIIDAFLKKNRGFGRQRIFDEHHLDFESIYDKQGWNVEYDKPGWDENYSPKFIFKIKK